MSFFPFLNNHHFSSHFSTTIPSPFLRFVLPPQHIWNEISMSKLCLLTPKPSLLNYFQCFSTPFVSGCNRRRRESPRSKWKNLCECQWLTTFFFTRYTPHRPHSAMFPAPTAIQLILICIWLVQKLLELR